MLFWFGKPIEQVAHSALKKKGALNRLRPKYLVFIKALSLQWHKIAETLLQVS